MPIKDKLWNFLYKGANADIKPAYLTAMGAGENYNDKWDPTTPEAQAAQKQLAETAALGAWTVAPEIMGPATFAHGAYDATKNGLNWQNGLEMALSAAPAAKSAASVVKAASEVPAFVGKANAISNVIRHQLDDAIKTTQLPIVVNTNIGWGPSQTIPVSRAGAYDKMYYPMRWDTQKKQRIHLERDYKVN